MIPCNYIWKFQSDDLSLGADPLLFIIIVQKSRTEQNRANAALCIVVSLYRMSWLVYLLHGLPVDPFSSRE